MAIYIIKNESNEEINRIVADLAFAEANYAGRYEEVIPVTDSVPEEDAARLWRNGELESTDKAAQTPDWPNRDNILTYRQALRDWPSTSDFPDTRPELGA
jgi:hypothetical protein